MEDYKKYVKKGLWTKFSKFCEMNSKDFYSSGIMTTAHMVMEYLAEGNSPKESWKRGMENNPGHSGMSAAATAVTIANYSIKGDEFKEWCKKEDIVMVNWGDK